MMFPDLDSQTNDDYNEDDYDSTQDHAHQIFYSINRFYKRDDQMKLFRDILSLVGRHFCFFQKTDKTYLEPLNMLH